MRKRWKERKLRVTSSGETITTNNRFISSATMSWFLRSESINRPGLNGNAMVTNKHLSVILERILWKLSNGELYGHLAQLLSPELSYVQKMNPKEVEPEVQVLIAKRLQDSDLGALLPLAQSAVGAGLHCLQRTWTLPFSEQNILFKNVDDFSVHLLWMTSVCI